MDWRFVNSFSADWYLSSDLSPFFDWSMFHLAGSPESRNGAELCGCAVIEFYSTYHSRIHTDGGYPNYLTRIAAGVESLVCASCDRKI